MAKEFNVGDRVFIPAKITKEVCGGHYKAEFFVGNDEAKTESFDAKVGTLFTAKQVSDKYTDGPTYDDLKTERDTLKMMLAERDRLLASANADVDKLRKEMAQREKGWDNVSRNNDVAKVNLNRLCKQREVLTDRIIALEAELEAEREKNNG